MYFESYFMAVVGDFLEALAFHFPFPGVGHVVRKGDGRQWRSIWWKGWCGWKIPMQRRMDTADSKFPRNDSRYCLAVT